MPCAEQRELPLLRARGGWLLLLRLRLRSLLLLLLLPCVAASCARAGQPAAGPPTSGPRRRLSVLQRAPRSCAASAKQRRQAQRTRFRAHRSLGSDRLGTTWLWGSDAGVPSVALLSRRSGEIVIARAPRVGATTVARVGRDRLLLLRTPQVNPSKPATVRFATLQRGRQGARFVGLGAAQALPLDSRWYIEAAASDGQRLLLFVRTLQQRVQSRVVLFDVASARPLGKPIDLAPSGYSAAERHAMWCAPGRGCTFVGVTGDGRTRRLVAVSFDAQGTATERALSTRHTLAVAAARLRRAWLLAWTENGQRALRLRGLALDGKPLGPTRSLALGAAEPLRLHLAGQRRGRRAWLATRSDFRSAWRLELLRLDEMGSVRRAGRRASVPARWGGLRPAYVRGLLAVGLARGGVTLSRGPIRMHSWSFEAAAALLDGVAAPTLWPLRRRSGLGRHGYRIDVLVAPPRVSLLLSPSAGGDSELFALSAPCR
ncbi:MAG: hypothetical protein KC503_14185 [Myxococcales bacterium]|nr:hypothetical protein [Myxococcales bacterium]